VSQPYTCCLPLVRDLYSEITSHIIVFVSDEWSLFTGVTGCDTLDHGSGCGKDTVDVSDQTMFGIRSNEQMCLSLDPIIPNIGLVHHHKLVRARYNDVLWNLCKCFIEAQRINHL